MRKFQLHSVAIFIVMLAVTAGSSYGLFRQSTLEDPLLPREQSVFPWEVIVTSDTWHGGKSQMSKNNASSTFDFDFTVNEGIEHPYVSYAVHFTPYIRPVALVDWSRYGELELRISCYPANVLAFSLHTHDDEVTNLSDYGSYRLSQTFFACGEEPRNVAIDLTRLQIPEWWMHDYKADYAARTYRLDKLQSFSLHNSAQSPRGHSVNVEITAATLHGRDWRYLYVAAALNLAMWGIFLRWYWQQKAAALVAEITEKLVRERQELPLVGYQQLPDDPRQDRETELVLRYMATRYAQPELNLEMAAAELGLNRTKLNAILKDELGLTFSTYINKLRLTEAARLLLETQSTIGEIGYRVGYNNAPYFTTVFKKEYGCTPGHFRKLMGSQEKS